MKGEGAAWGGAACYGWTSVVSMARWVATCRQAARRSDQRECEGRTRRRCDGSGRRLFRRVPGVGLVGGVAAPAIERVVERHAGVELREIVGVHAREPERGCQQPGRLRRRVEAGGIGAAHDGRSEERRVGKGARRGGGG